ncbi:hypothetical protein EC973_003920 [Apophysomyces ossiformis]|uniref:CENP-T/Histone H4 histone fold domain-containing protein n=1 Tax=Apophysomyces ossiformis TaxID=679940 RepID=A0A8H7BGQ3_9FUNG|nr:hypothetical protein EC973_003920 [Apophysomyces ossiformis]
MKTPTSRRSSSASEASSHRSNDTYVPSINQIHTPSELLRILSRFPQLQSNSPTASNQKIGHDEQNRERKHEHIVNDVSTQETDAMLEFERRFNSLRRRKPQIGKGSLGLGFRRRRYKQSELKDYDDSLTEKSYDTNTDFSEFSRLDHMENDTQDDMGKHETSFIGGDHSLASTENVAHAWQPPTPREAQEWSFSFSSSSAEERHDTISLRNANQANQELKGPIHATHMEGTQVEQSSTRPSAAGSLSHDEEAPQEHEEQSPNHLLDREADQQQEIWEDMPDDFAYDFDEPIDEPQPTGDGIDAVGHPSSRSSQSPYDIQRDATTQPLSGTAFIRRRMEERLRDPSRVKQPMTVTKAVQKKLFTVFSRTKVDSAALSELWDASELFFDQLANDLQVQADYEQEDVITVDGVKKLMEKQNILDNKTTLEGLAHRILPRELWDMMCTSALADNVLYPDSFE